MTEETFNQRIPHVIDAAGWKYPLAGRACSSTLVDTEGCVRTLKGDRALIDANKLLRDICAFRGWTVNFMVDFSEFNTRDKWTVTISEHKHPIVAGYGVTQEEAILDGLTWLVAISGNKIPTQVWNHCNMDN